MENYQNRRWYVKKPIRVQAYQTYQTVVIKTLEGDMVANAGDWIVTGVKNEQYPVKNDIFMATYERVEEMS